MQLLEKIMVATTLLLAEITLVQALMQKVSHIINPMMHKN
jgi:hypothetical protein